MVWPKFDLDQAAVANLEYNPIIHDLALEPRAHSAEQAVDIWLDMWVSSYIEDIFNTFTVKRPLFFNFSLHISWYQSICTCVIDLCFASM